MIEVQVRQKDQINIRGGEASVLESSKQTFSDAVVTSIEQDACAIFCRDERHIAQAKKSALETQAIAS